MDQWMNRGMNIWGDMWKSKLRKLLMVKMNWQGKIPREGNGNPLKCSCLKNSMDRGAWQATVHGVAKSRTWLKDFHLFHMCSNFVNSEDGLAFDFGHWHSLKTPILLKIKNLSLFTSWLVPTWHRSQLGKYHCFALRVGLSPFPLPILFCLQKQPSSVRKCWKSILKVLFKKLKKKF